MQAFQIEVLPHPAALVQRGIELWRQWSAAAIADHGVFTVALSGGSTPKQYFAGLAAASGIDWQHTYVFWGDERYVPHDHPDSNYKMAKESLLDHVSIPQSQIFPMPTSSADPAEDATIYTTQLKQVFHSQWPQFDLNLLGIGEDGHTASLFPGTAALQVQDQWVTVGEKSGSPRLTLTLPAINHSRQTLFLVAGANKAEILRQVLTTDPHLPSQWVQPTGRLLWFLDAAAAAKLPLPLGSLGSV
jgi:6-phosphogluconolactonase